MSHVLLQKNFILSGVSMWKGGYRFPLHTWALYQLHMLHIEQLLASKMSQNVFKVRSIFTDKFEIRLLVSNSVHTYIIRHNIQVKQL